MVKMFAAAKMFMAKDTNGEHTRRASLVLKNEAKRKLKIVIFLLIVMK